MADQQLTTMSTMEFSAKYNSKNEIYKFLATDCGVYLPPKDTCTVFHLRDIMRKKRQWLKANAVKTIQLPYYDTLTIKDILQWAAQWQNGSILLYLPQIQRETLKLPRSFLANVIYTCAGDEFKTWVNGRIRERNQKIAEQNNVLMELDPELKVIFDASNSVSNQKGISSNLLKPTANRRRSKLEIEEQKRNEEIEREAIARKIAQMEQLEAELRDYRDKYQRTEQLANCAQGMLDAGVLSQENNGTYTLVEGYEQRIKEMQSQPMQQQQLIQAQQMYQEQQIDSMQQQQQMQPVQEQIKPGRPRRRAAQQASEGQMEQ